MDRDKTLALYEQLVATKPRVERKGDTIPYTSLNGRVPDSLLAKTADVKQFFDLSCAYVSPEKPNPTTKPKKQAATKPRHG